MIATAVNGFFMALADSVPGVSGGTIALILGFYDQFIGAVHGLIYGGKEEKKRALFYLLKLGVGWGAGMVLAVLVLTSFFEKNIYAVSSVFLGFVLFSIPVIVREEWACVRGRWNYVPFVLLGTALVVLLAYTNSRLGTSFGDLSHLTVASGIYIFVSGLAAVTAMFLPGISGSTILLIFGVYVPVLEAVKELLHLNLRYLPTILVFACGVLAGAVTAVKGIRVCLERFRSQTVYLIIGMLCGSLYAIVLGPTTLDRSNTPLFPGRFSLLFFLVGAAVILLIQGLRMYREKRKR